MKYYAVIPARYASVRLPGKPLRMLGDRPLVLHVAERAVQSGAEEVIVATDDERIAAACRAGDVRVTMTSDAHRSGTDRVAEVARLAGWPDSTIVVNVQGDEPLLAPANVRQVALALHNSDADIATLATPVVASHEYSDPNVVKVVRDKNGRALYFSRAPIPALRGSGEDAWRGTLRHVGLYAYRVGALAALAGAPECDLERREALEQLRAQWLGLSIQVELAAEVPGPGVDTEDDLARVAAQLATS